MKYFQKLAGSNLYFSPGRGDLKNSYSPSTAYHYRAQGKYSRPGVTDTRKKSGLTELEQMGSDETARYVSPQNVKEYIKRYDRDVQNTIATQAGSWEKNPDRKLIEKLLGRNKKHFVENPTRAKQIYNSPEFQKEHKAVLRYMAKQKDGFTVRVG